MAENTQQLIAKLVENHQPVRPLFIAPIIYLTVAAVLLLALLLIIPLGVRLAWPLTGFIKSGGLFLLVLAAAQLTLLLGQPIAPNWRRAYGFWATLFGSMLLFSALAIVGQPLTWQQALAVPSFWVCFSWVSVVGVLASVGFYRMLRRARPLHRVGLRLAVGSLAGIVAASVYSLHCQVDAIAYLLLAYGVAASSSVMLGWLLSMRLWRW